MEIKTTQNEVRKALVNTFRSFGYHITDYDVWAGIHTYFADRFLKALNNIELEKKGVLKKEPDYPNRVFKKIFGKVYYRTRL